jgi:hypothetical protein
VLVTPKSASTKGATPNIFVPHNYTSLNITKYKHNKNNNTN